MFQIWSTNDKVVAVPQRDAFFSGRGGRGDKKL